MLHAVDASIDLIHQYKAISETPTTIILKKPPASALLKLRAGRSFIGWK